MITKDNYFSLIKNLDFSSLPSNYKEAHEFVVEATGNGSTWEAYEDDKDVKEVIDGYFKMLDAYLNKKPSSKQKAPSVKTKAVEKKPVKKPNKPVKANYKVKVRDEDIEWVERVPEELRFMNRYVNMNGKKKTTDQVRNLINGIQKAIIERRIRKTSPYAKQITYTQKKLVELYNQRSGNYLEVSVPTNVVKEFKELIHKEAVLKSVLIIKRFIGIQGRNGVEEKAERLMAAIKRANANATITRSDKYAKKIQEIYSWLSQYLEHPTHNSLHISQHELNGLLGMVGECGCKHELDGVDVPEDYVEEEEQAPAGEQRIMNSMDFANMTFRNIGFKGKWLDLMGDPAPGFTAMVFGKPKMGKSFLCIEFAGYLSRYHGKVLYVAREEGLDATLQKKVNETNVQNENLFVTDNLPSDLSSYDFIFLDSVNKLGLGPADLDKLRRDNPGKSFIFVFQTTKDGNFKGKNEFQHDVDIVIEVYEQGKASQYGRYNQGGEMNIFENNISEAA